MNFSQDGATYVASRLAVTKAVAQELEASLDVGDVADYLDGCRHDWHDDGPSNSILLLALRVDDGSVKHHQNVGRKRLAKIAVDSRFAAQPALA